MYKFVSGFTVCLFLAACGGSGDPITASTASNSTGPVAEGPVLSNAEKGPFLFDWWYRSILNEPGCKAGYAYNTKYFYKDGHMILAETTMSIENTLYNDANCESYAGAVTEHYRIAWAKGSAVQAPFNTPVARIANQYSHYALDVSGGTGVELVLTPNGSHGTHGRTKMTGQVATHEGTTHQALYLPIDGSPLDADGYPTHLEMGEFHRHKLVDGCC